MIIRKTKQICLYNADIQEFIGIFATQALAGKYMYQEKWVRKTQTRLSYALKNKVRITDSTLFSHPIAVRYANPEQLALLGEKSFHVSEGYPVPSEAAMRGFDSDRLTLYLEGKEKLETYFAKKREKKPPS